MSDKKRNVKWVAGRRFATTHGGKYFAGSPVTVWHELAYHVTQDLKIPPEMQPPIDIYEFHFASNLESGRRTLKLLSVCDADLNSGCAKLFREAYGVSHTETLSSDDYGPSQAVAAKLDYNDWLGVEWPSVRHPGGKCTIIVNPLERLSYTCSERPAYHPNAEMLAEAIAG